ncbi:MAG: hypothetical protein ABIO72_03455 [Patescibacteria group bacterium]
MRLRLCRAGDSFSASSDDGCLWVIPVELADLTLPGAVDTVTGAHCTLSISLEEAARAVYLVEEI